MLTLNTVRIVLLLWLWPDILVGLRESRRDAGRRGRLRWEGARRIGGKRIRAMRRAVSWVLPIPQARA